MRAFVSSTWKDLEEYRSEVIGALRELGWTVPNPYEANPRPTPEALEHDVRSCDCLIGLTGHFYGSRIAPRGRSYTEFEYDICAGPNGPYALMFLADDNFRSKAIHLQTAKDRNDQKKFRTKIKSRAGYFNEISDLVKKVLIAASHQSARGRIRIRGSPIHTLPDRFENRRKPREELCDWLTKEEVPIAEVIGKSGVGKSSLCWVWLAQDVLGHSTCGARPISPQPSPPVEGILWWAFAPDSARFDQFVRIALGHVCPDSDSLVSKRSPAEDLGVLLNELEKKRFVIVLDGFERMMRGYSVTDGAYVSDETRKATSDEIANPDAQYFVREIYSRRESFQSRVVMTSLAGISDLDHPNDGRIRIQIGGFDSNADVIRLLDNNDPDEGPGRAGVFYDSKSPSALEKRNNKLASSLEEIRIIGETFGSIPAIWQAVNGVVLKTEFNLSSIAEKTKSWAHKSVNGLFGDFLLETSLLGDATTALLRMLSRIRGPFSFKEFLIVRTRLAFSVTDEQTAELAAEQQLNGLVQMGLLKRIDLGTDPGAEPLFVLSTAVAVTPPAADAIEVPDGLSYDVDSALQTPRAMLKLVARVKDELKDELACHLLEILEKSPAYEFGSIQTEIELLQVLLPRCSNPDTGTNERALYAAKLQQLALLYSRTGQSDLAISNLRESVAIYGELNDTEGIAAGLGMLATEHLRAGNLAEAESDLHALIDLYRDMAQDSQLTKALLALVMIRNSSDAGVDSLPLDTFLKTCFEGHQTEVGEFQSIFHSLRALRLGDPSRAADYARHALDHIEEGDLVLKTRVHWLLGESLLRMAQAQPDDARITGDLLAQAEGNLRNANEFCELLFWPDYWADILISQAKLLRAQGRPQDAAVLGERARMHSARHGYRLKLADVHILLAQISYESGSISLAQIHAAKARDLADCGEGPYKYQPAFDIADGLIQKCAAE